MDTAYLPADHRDAGANRVVAVLEELRDGLENKFDQELEIARSERNLTMRCAAAERMTAFRTAIDDIALFIQREQRS